MRNLSKPDLAEAVSDVLVDRGTLRRIHINGNRTQALTLLVDADITVSEAKTLLFHRLKIPEHEQLWKNQDKESLFYGPLFSATTTAVEATFRIETKPWDPRQEALLSWVGLDHNNWQERDEIMAKLAMKRKAKHCYKGHELVESQERNLPTECSVCHQTCGTQRIPTLLTGINQRQIQSRPNRRVCSKRTEWCCQNFALCEDCYSNDGDTKAAATMAAPGNPFDALIEIGRDWGRNIFSRAKNGIGLGFPLDVRPHHLEYAPRRLLAPWTEQDLVLPEGLRFVLRFGSKETNSYGKDLPNQVCVDRILESGMTLQDLHDLLQETLAKIWERGFRQHEAWFDLASFDLDHVDLIIRLVSIESRANLRRWG